MRDHVFAHTRRAPGWVVLLCVVMYALGVVLLFNFDAYRENILKPIGQATGGLCTGTLVNGIIGMALCVGVVVVLGRLRLADVGLRGADLPAAVAGTLGLWAAVSAISIVAAIAAGDGLEVRSTWATDGVTRVLGKLLGHLAGNALLEETVFRGLLIAQVYFFLERKLSDRPRARMAVAVFLAQLAFAWSHVPNRLAQGSYDTISLIVLDQAVLIIMGLLLAWLYLRTQNLLLAIGVHALVNAPTMVFASPLDGGGAQGAVVVLAVIVLLLWPFLRRRGAGS